MSSRATPSASASRSDPSKDSQRYTLNSRTSLAARQNYLFGWTPRSISGLDDLLARKGMLGVQGSNQSSKDILSVIDSLKKQVAVERCIFIKKRMVENNEKLIGVTNHVYTLSKERSNSVINNTEKNLDLLTKRQRDAFGMLNGLDLTNGEKDKNGSQEDSYASSAVLVGSSFGMKNVVRPIKLPEVKKLPPYTTWIFLDRNQRMTEDQSVVGRRRIYYDQNGGEALICSDSEEEIVEEEEEKREFVDSEDYILRMTIQEVGLSDAVLDSLAQCFSRSPCEVKARYEILMKGEKDAQCEKKGSTDDKTQMDDSFFDKDLDAALDSFDNLFCRRCLVFDCRLHGCSQDLVFPAEKQLPWNYTDEENVPCGVNCYRLAQKLESNAIRSSPVHNGLEEKPVPSSGSAGDQISPRKKESSESEIRPRQDNSSIHNSSSPQKAKLVGKCGVHKRNSKRVAERVFVCMRKRQKKMIASDSDFVVSGCVWPRDMKLRSNSRKENEEATSSQRKVKTPPTRKPKKKELPAQDSSKSTFNGHDEPSDEMVKGPPEAISDETSKKEEFVDESICKNEATGDKSWKTIEKGLFAKGLEIFGRNSCLIARNLLNGMKTCADVYQYMSCTENKLSNRVGDGTNSLVEGHSKVDYNDTMGSELRTRSRFVRRRGRVRRLKYTWKSAGYHSIRKRITERKDQPCRQFNPCNCKSACGKQCACLLNGTCCEKYCGCPKSCKNRFRGCHCAKSQCRSRQCPCFAADRECDPDVCRNCWVGCGDGTLGVPSQRGDNYECRNMKLLLKQQQRVLLGRSDVSGWGAFLKNSVGKHEYLGEYTGELISHREADKRGKIYDRENSSFLFNLNDQFVLDAYRKGDKLKFANHSPDPNCYAKVIMVAGDHRVGIFAKERINAGEELFYDYRYEPDRAPAWAKKPETTGSKKEEAVTSSGRAKKLA
ncbi:PREDICTED: histone-lysine N-methyltransferase CLF-like isoform X2 [Nelumbo nucifera]|uniref:Histone-lysine N-methyltransferase CLF-like isoform X2 n=1 Tax=Nelumbo nucifera TaxID=4432 RepID=A0A1U8ADB6_NELNU|nr:PREDICTED: histone-lysine N-methyltransferase CLF-like isoform X2 [Nelumbo nucifera]